MRRAKPSVCMVPYLLPPGHSGAATQAWHLARALAKQGLKISLIGRRSYGESRLQVLDGVRIIRIHDSRSNHTRLNSKVFGARLMAWLISNRDKCSLVHFHGIRDYVYPCILLGRTLHIPSIVKLSLVGVDDPITLRNSSILGLFKVQILSKTDGIVGTSPALAQACYGSNIKCRVFEIPNGVDTELYHPVRNRAPLRQKLGIGNCKMVIFVGGITPRKGVDTLIGAWKHVISKIPDARLFLVGSTDKNKTYKNFSETLKKTILKSELDKNVIFLGQVSNVVEYLQASDMFVFPSRKEGMPNALLEAMACGLPSVVSHLPGITDTIIERGVSGYLVKDYKNSREFAEQIVTLLDDQELRKKMGELARETIEKNYSIQKVATKYIELYEQLGFEIK